MLDNLPSNNPVGFKHEEGYMFRGISIKKDNEPRLRSNNWNEDPRDKYTEGYNG